jgi:hypothetical protein
LKSHGIRFAGKPLGRPRKVTEENREQLKRLKAQRRQDYLQRIPIEGKFGQGKNGYGLNYIRAKRADTSSAWINTIFLVMDLLILLRIFLPDVKEALHDCSARYCEFRRACSVLSTELPRSMAFSVRSLHPDFLSRLYVPRPIYDEKKASMARRL